MIRDLPVVGGIAVQGTKADQVFMQGGKIGFAKRQIVGALGWPPFAGKAVQVGMGGIGQTMAEAVKVVQQGCGGVKAAGHGDDILPGLAGKGHDVALRSIGGNDGFGAGIGLQLVR